MLECEGRDARKRWSREFEDFEKEAVLELAVGQASIQLNLCHWGIENWVLRNGVE